MAARRRSVSYKVPRIVVKDYSGPAGLQQLPASASIVDIYRVRIGAIRRGHGDVHLGAHASPGP